MSIDSLDVPLSNVRRSPAPGLDGRSFRMGVLAIHPGFPAEIMLRSGGVTVYSNAPKKRAPSEGRKSPLVGLLSHLTDRTDLSADVINFRHGTDA